MFWMAKNVGFSVAAEPGFFRGFSVQPLIAAGRVDPPHFLHHIRRRMVVPIEHTSASEYAERSKPFRKAGTGAGERGEAECDRGVAGLKPGLNLFARNAA
jgi:hypothetical protein